MDKTILVIEDDIAIRNLITTALSTEGYAIHYVSTGKAAVAEAVALQPDLFILDLGLPDMDGSQFITTVRTWTDNPIIVVSARSEAEDKIGALDAGADDYLTKPFSVGELLARIRVALRRRRGEDCHTTDSVYTNGDLRIDYAAGCVWMAQREVHLTPIEYRLLCLLSQHTGKVLTHKYILQEIWSSDLDSDTQSLRVFMATLRKKIESNPASPTYLQTHVGVGYRMIRIIAPEQVPGQETGEAKPSA